MRFPDHEWSEDPAQCAFNPELLKGALDAIAQFGSISTIIIRGGYVAESSGNMADKVLVRSIRKSFLSALIGIAVCDGYINLDATLEEIGIDDNEPCLTLQEKQATIRDLLQARSGVYHSALAETPEMTKSKPVRGSEVPGTRWHYNNWDFNALGSIYEKLTGLDVYSGFWEKIAKPIGMQDFCLDDCFYVRGAASYHPAYHLKMSVRDMARFGHLFLNRGCWNERQIIPAKWISESTVAYSHTQTALGGYGYMWWTTGHSGEAESSSIAARNSKLPKFRYYAFGGDGQMICIVPEKHLVLATFSVSKQRENAEWGKFWKFVRSAISACPNV